MKRDSYPTPCETFAYGEVEDYAVNITGAGTASAAAAKNGTFNVSMNPAGSRLFKLEFLNEAPEKLDFFQFF